MWRDLGGGPLDAPFCIDVTLPRLPTPTGQRGAPPLVSPIQRRLCAAYLSPASEREFYFVGAQLFFILGNRGFSAEPGYFCLPTYEAQSGGSRVQLRVVPHTIDSAGYTTFYHLYK